MIRPAPDARTAEPMGAAEVSALVERAVQGLLRDLLVRGDLINVSHGRLHAFAGLRDRGIVLRVFIHARVLRRLAPLPPEGTAVVIRASPAWYRFRGDLQLVVDDLRIVDARRARHETIARLRAELAADGLMDANRRLPLSRLPAHVAVVGGETSAAVLDVLHAVHRRAPWTRITLHTTRLQGSGAARDIAAAIGQAAASGAQAVAVVRGGGGKDDFTPFDTREVCTAIAHAPVPVVTALGHEQDRSLADAAAHSSASTPTDAARLLVPDGTHLKRDLASARNRLRLALERAQGCSTEAADRLAHRLASNVQNVLQRTRTRFMASDPRRQVSSLRALAGRERQKAGELIQRLCRSAAHKSEIERSRVRGLAAGATRSLVESLRSRRDAFDGLSTRLTLAHPDAVVARGFVIARDAGDLPITSSWDARTEGEFDLQFSDGTVRVQVVPSTPAGGDA